MDYKDILAEHDKNFAAMEARDKAAKEAGTMVGRYINYPVADGYAYYEIVKVNLRTVVVVCLTGLGDDWVLDLWGAKARIGRLYAETHLARRDAWAELFASPA